MTVANVCGNLISRLRLVLIIILVFILGKETLVILRLGYRKLYYRNLQLSIWPQIVHYNSKF